jgi:hypothetical protein
MTPVQSTNLRAIGYDLLAGTLTVEFHGGRRYAYAGVPWSEYRRLLQAKSHGACFHARIRNRYPYRRLR